MAKKMKGAKQFDMIPKAPDFPKQEGVCDKKVVVLSHNVDTSRYDLIVDGKMVYSATHGMCLHKAEMLGVTWNIA